MALIIRRPLIAASLALSSLALIGFLWQKRRQECSEDNQRCPLLGDSKEAVNSNLELIHTKLENIEGDSTCAFNAVKNDTNSDRTKVMIERDSTEQHMYNLAMTEEDNVTSNDDLSAVPNLEVALKDPLCSSLPPTSASSPVKSESADSQRSGPSEAWSDLIERDEEMLRAKLKDDFSYEIDLSIDERARQDSGVASPSTEVVPKECFSETKVRSDSSGDDAGLGGSELGDNGSDSGQGSDVYCDDSQLLAYHFHLAEYLCGKLIGTRGEFINKLKSDTNCNVIVKEMSDFSPKKRNRLKTWSRKNDTIVNLCIIEGTRSNIDKCLDIIRGRFARHPEVTLEQINKPENNSLSLSNGSMYLNLVEGMMHDVIVSTIVSGAHVFIQQPGHPTFSALERLNSCINKTYSQLTCPQLARPIAPNTVCVSFCQGAWYRCQVMNYDEDTESCDVKFVDYGGYQTVPASDMRQIRTDFLSLPFQAIECYLANVVLPDDDLTAGTILEELTFGQVLQARMIGCDENEVSMVHLYRVNNGQTVMINKELVDRGSAHWISATIIPRDQTSTVAHF